MIYKSHRNECFENDIKQYKEKFDLD